MEKYGLLRERLASSDLLQLAVPEAATRPELERVHDRAYVNRVFEGRLTPDEVRKIGFPWSLQLVERSKRSVGGTIAAARSALDDGVSANLAGGTHHAFADRGEGFCVFNDVAVALEAIRAEGRAERFAVLDLDVHQGDGTADIFRSDEAVFTLSVHGENNFPFRKSSSDLDVGLPDGVGDSEFLAAVERGVQQALSGAPQLAFFVAGADPFEGDRLGRLSVSKEGLEQRDRLVFDLCRRTDTAVAIVMSGGYARDIQDTVDIHEATVLAAAGTAERVSLGRRSPLA